MSKFDFLFLFFFMRRSTAVDVCRSAMHSARMGTPVSKRCLGHILKPDAEARHEHALRLRVRLEFEHNAEKILEVSQVLDRVRTDGQADIERQTRG